MDADPFGFTEEDLARRKAYDRFGAAALRQAGRRVDSGLDPAFCRAAADALGARISVQSDGVHGTAFTLELP